MEKSSLYEQNHTRYLQSILFIINLFTSVLVFFFFSFSEIEVMTSI